MSGAFEMLRGAQWLYQQLPHVNQIVYQAHADFALIQTGGHMAYVITAHLETRNLSGIKNQLAAVVPWVEAPIRSHVFHRFPRLFCERPGIEEWLSKASWVVRNALEVQYVGLAVTETIEFWHAYTDKGYVSLKMSVEGLNEKTLAHALGDVPDKDEPATPVVWVSRYFLEDWYLCEQAAKNTAAMQEVSTKVPEVVEEALPPDLRGVLQNRGRTRQEIREAHIAMILNGMMTRTAPPRFK